MKKRLLSVLLAGVMVFSQSGAVLAAENSGAGDTAIAIVEEEAQSEGREEAPEEDSANEAGQTDDAQEISGAETAGEEDSDVTDRREDETAQPSEGSENEDVTDAGTDADSADENDAEGAENTDGAAEEQDADAAADEQEADAAADEQDADSAAADQGADADAIADEEIVAENGKDMYMSEQSYKLWPEKIEEKLYAGKEITVTPEIRAYSADNAGEYTVMPADQVQFSVTAENTNLTITESSTAQGTYVIHRSNAESCRFTIDGYVWSQEKNEYVKAGTRSYYFGKEYFSMWFERTGRSLYTNEEDPEPLTLNCTSMAEGWTDELDLEFTVGTEENGELSTVLDDDRYLVSKDGDNYVITFSEEYLKSLEENEDIKSQHLLVTADLYAKGVEHTEDNRLNKTSVDVYIYCPIAEYQTEQDRYMLVGDNGTLGGPGKVHVQDSEHPAGPTINYRVLNVEVISDEPLEGAGGNVLSDLTFYEYGTEGSDNYVNRWSYTAEHCGKAVLKVTYEDIKGQEQSYEFTVYVTGDRRRPEIRIADGSQYGLPGTSKQLKAVILHDTVGDTEQKEDDLHYEWKIISGEYNASIEEDGDQATVTFRDLDDSEKEWAETHKDAWGNDYEYNESVIVEMIVYTNGEDGRRIEVGRDNVFLQSMQDYYTVKINGADESLGIGESEDVTVFLAKYSYFGRSDSQEYEVVPNAHFKVEDNNSYYVDVTDDHGNPIGSRDDADGNWGYQDSEYTTGSECTFTLRRLIANDWHFGISAEYTDADGNKQTTEPTIIHLRKAESDLFFENPEDELKNNEEKTFRLNADSLGDLEYEIDYQVGRLKKDPYGKDSFEVFMYKDEEYTVDPDDRSIKINGEKAWDALKRYAGDQTGFDIRASLNIVDKTGNQWGCIGEAFCHVEMIEAVKKPREVSYAVETTGINESMGIGERNEITVKLLKYSYYDDSEEAVCEVVPDAHFKWGYDPHSIEIRDANGNVVGNTDEYGEYQDSEYSSGGECTFTIQRLTGDESYFSLQAEYTDGSVNDYGGYIIYTADAPEFYLCERELDVFFDNKEDRHELRSDEEKAFHLNTDSLSDLDYVVEYNAGYLEKDEYGAENWRWVLFKGDEEYWDYKVDQENQNVIASGENIWKSLQLQNSENNTDWTGFDIQAIVYLVRDDGLTRLGDTVCHVEMVESTKKTQTLEVDPERIMLPILEGAQIHVTGAETAVTFTSSDESVVRVDVVNGVGYLTPVSLGTATILVEAEETDEYKAASVPVNVQVVKQQQPVSIGIPKTKAAIGEKVQLKVYDAQGKVSYTVSPDTTYATVSSTGLVTAKKAGTVSITVRVPETDQYEAYSETVKITIVPAATSSLTAVNLVTGIKLTWKAVAGASGYRVYRNNSLIATLAGSSKVTYTDKKGNTNGSKYVYKVVAYRTINNVKVASTKSKSVAIYRVARPAITSLKNSSSRKMTVKWGKNTKANGYEIQYCLKSNFASGRKTVTISKSSTITTTIKNLLKGKIYYVRVRTFKKVGGKKYYSAWSVIRKLKISK